jgi:hypothetical protein
MLKIMGAVPGSGIVVALDLTGATHVVTSISPTLTGCHGQASIR